VNELELRINGKKFVFWTEATITRSLDGMDQFGFSTPMNTTDSDFRNTFRPFSYPSLEVWIDDELIFTGTGVDIRPQLSDNSRVLSVSGYSQPGVLNDCTPSVAAFPTEFNQQTLSEIASTLCEPFGIFVDSSGLSGETLLKRSRLESDQKILPFLIKLAKQQGLFLTNTEKGFLKFIEPITVKGSERGAAPSSPVARLVQGQPPLKDVSVSFNPQEYYSDITALKPSVLGLEGKKRTVKNERLAGVLRPLVFIAVDSDEGSMQKAAQSKMGRMFGNAVSYAVELPTWRDPQGDLWKKNTIVNLLAPDVMVYKETALLIRAVEFFKDSDSETATLNLVLPEAFTGKIPEVMPWD